MGPRGGLARPLGAASPPRRPSSGCRPVAPVGHWPGGPLGASPAPTSDRFVRNTLRKPQTQ
eukprot:5650184-Prymnesium_polylepis.1